VNNHVGRRRRVLLQMSLLVPLLSLPWVAATAASAARSSAGIPAAMSITAPFPTAYVAAANGVIPVSLSSDTAEPTIPASGSFDAITPDAARVLVSSPSGVSTISHYQLGRSGDRDLPESRRGGRRTGWEKRVRGLPIWQYPAAH
jgi:hypothetical protein